MKGEYYVFCRRCGIKYFNTDAVYTHETGWLCKMHAKEIQEFDSGLPLPTETVFKPQIVRAPKAPTFGAAPDAYWETIEVAWETIDDEWENY